MTQIVLEKDNNFTVQRKVNAFDYNKILPNETITQSIKLENAKNESVNFYVYNETKNKEDLTNSQKEALKKILRDKISVTISDVNGKILYQGSALFEEKDIPDGEIFTSPSYKVATLTNRTDDKAFTISVHKDADLTNEDNALIGNTVWQGFFFFCMIFIVRNYRGKRVWFGEI